MPGSSTPNFRKFIITVYDIHGEGHLGTSVKEALIQISITANWNYQTSSSGLSHAEYLLKKSTV
jgi:hypothetical protein